MVDLNHSDWFNLYLAGVAGFSKIPPTVSTAAADEGRIAAQHDVEDDAEAPQVTALIVDGGFLAEGLHNLRGHVLCRATLRRQRNHVLVSTSSSLHSWFRWLLKPKTHS